MCYNARANIIPDKDFKQDITFDRKNTQQKLILAKNRMANLYSVHYTFLFLDE